MEQVDPGKFALRAIILVSLVFFVLAVYKVVTTDYLFEVLFYGLTIPFWLFVGVLSAVYGTRFDKGGRG